MALLLSRTVSAEPARAEAVLVLEAPSAGWKAGVQALVAELLTVGYELRVRAATARERDGLERELEQQVADSGARAGVAVTREGDRATALLCRRDSRECEHISVEIADAELSRSRLALAVVERLRPVDLPLAPPSASPEPPRQAPRPVAPPPRERFPAEPARGVRTWVGAGAVLSSGTSAPTPWLSATLGALLADPWGIELSVAGSPLAGRAVSRAGTLSLRAFEAVGFATFEPFPRRRWGFGLGLGGGALRLQETASPAPGFDAFSRGVTVGVVSARARLFSRVGPVFWGVSVDPGMLVPAVKIEAGEETILRMGRPWLALQTTLGLQL